MKYSQATDAQLTCPECSAVVITPQPEAIIWEHCPSCGMHVWDDNDLLMAERVPARRRGSFKSIQTVKHPSN